MSRPSVVKGGYFDVAVEADPIGSPGVFTTICGLTSKTLTHQVNTSDEAVPNCDDPEEVPWVSRIANTQEKNKAGTGLHNRAQTNLIRSIFGRTLNYRFIEGEPGHDLVNQGYWQGPYLFANWQEGATDIKGNVSSQFTWVSDGEVLWHAGTAPTLADLTLSSVAATAETPWTATITGKTPGSTIEAEADDGTVLAVIGTTISGTFTDAGTVSVTLTETNPEASNSPHVTTVEITVTGA